jgi:alpha-L-fucosidase
MNRSISTFLICLTRLLGARWHLLIFLASSSLSSAAFDPFTETTSEYNSRAQWMRDAKFGVFLHWNPSSLVGGEISWCRDSVGRTTYDALYQNFQAENFNADQWVTLFHNAGIRYAVVVPKHHDGFSMFNTATSSYNVMNSPFGRDYVKEMADACGRSDVRFCLYYSVLDWWNPLYSSAAGADLTRYKNEVFKPHMRELLSNYGPVGCIWFDGHWDASWTHADGREMYSYVRNLQPSTLIGNRIDQKATADGPYCSWTGSFFNGAPDPVGDYQAREVDLGKYYTGKAWDSCFSLCGVNSKWSWVPPMNPRPLSEVIGWLVQCIGRDGSMLLGVGPRADGTIDPASSARLLEVGSWMTSNGDAVYGTRGGPYLPGDWCVSTRKGNKVFLFVTKWSGETLSLPALPANVVSSRLIGGPTVPITSTGSKWNLTVPESSRTAIVTIVELTLDQDAMAMNTIALPGLKLVSSGKPVVASGEWLGRETELSKNHVNDGNFNSIWAGPENSRSGWVEIDLGEDHLIEDVLLDDGPYQRCEAFQVQAQIAGVWQTIVGGTNIGARKDLGFAPTLARRFRLMISQANEVPTLAEFQLFERDTSSIQDGVFINPSPGSNYSIPSNWENSVVTSGCVIGSGGASFSALYDSPGITSSSGALTLGNGTGSNGMLTLNGSAGALTYTSANIGAAGGSGSLVLNAGALNSGDLVLGTAGSGASGSMLLSGGNATASRLIIGDASASTNTFTLNSGFMTVTGSSGLYTVIGGGAGTSTTLGTLHLNGGTLNTGMISEYVPAVTSVVNLNGGTLQAAIPNANFLTADTVNVLGGGAKIDSNSNAITISKPLAAGIGNGGLTKSGASTLTLTAKPTGSAMNLTANNGTLKLAATGFAFNNPGGFGNGGTLTANSGATLELNGPYNLGYSQPLVVNGGTVTITSGFSFDGQQYTENVHFSGGGTISGNAMRLGELGDGGTVSVTGSVPATIQTGFFLINASGKTGKFNVTSTGGSAADLTISGVIADYSGAPGLPLIKSGNGILRLSATNTYSGATTVSAGKLQVDCVLGSAITVNPFATLCGSGRTTGSINIQSGATIAPGAGGCATLSTGTATLTGTYACEVDGPNSDRLAVTGNLNLTGSRLALTTPGSAATANSYVIASYTGSLTGTFGSVTGLPSTHAVSYDSGNKQILLTRNSYGQFLAPYLLAGTDAEPTADPDHDEIPNGIEFILGSDPTTSSSDRNPTAAVVGANLIYQFRRTTSATAYNPVVQVSSNLAQNTWQAVTSGISVEPNFYGSGVDKVSVTVPRNSSAKLFVRLSVTIP